MLITFEGIDGSGKTTIIEMLKKYFKKIKIKNIIYTKEPSGTNKEMKKISNIILNPKYEIPPMVEAILYAANRRFNLEKNIWPAIKKKQIILCDRYFDSSLVYQGFARKLGIEKIQKLQDLILEKTYPNLTIFFDIKIKEASKRTQKNKKDKLELENYLFKKNVYKGYKKIIKRDSKRFEIVDASKNIEEVFENVKKIINKILKLK